ncbi:unnamed protein product [Calypogeia fissa]
MGGCCAHAPGTLGPAASRGAMVDGITSSDSREDKSNGSSCGGDDFSELTAGAEGTRTSVFQVLRAGGAQESCSTPPVEKRGTTVDVEKLLRVLEVAVEREYADGLRDRFNASNEYREMLNLCIPRWPNLQLLPTLYQKARSRKVASTTALREPENHAVWNRKTEAPPTITGTVKASKGLVLTGQKEWKWL